MPLKHFAGSASFADQKQKRQWCYRYAYQQKVSGKCIEFAHSGNQADTSAAADYRIPGQIQNKGNQQVAMLEQKWKYLGWRTLQQDVNSLLGI